jgi:hypothetical protein
MQTNNVDLKQPKLPKLLSDLTQSNQFLKVLSISTTCIAAIALILIFVLATRTPVVLTMDTKAQIVDRESLPNPEIEIQAAIKHYLGLRYQWTPENVKQKLSAAQSMVHSSAIKSYLGAALNVGKFSAEKQVAQRVYAASIKVDVEKNVVHVLGDRITAIQGLKAAGDLKLDLNFDYGPRTKENPWGVYFVKEHEM